MRGGRIPLGPDCVVGATSTAPVRASSAGAGHGHR